MDKNKAMEVAINICICFQFLNVDNGGGMTPDTMRQCMSLGYSMKSKFANTIGQCELCFIPC